MKDAVILLNDWFILVGSANSIGRYAKYFSFCGLLMRFNGILFIMLNIAVWWSKRKANFTNAMILEQMVIQNEIEQ